MPNVAWSRERNTNSSRKPTFIIGLLIAVGWASCALADQPLVIQKQGSFMAGGTVVSSFQEPSTR